MSNLIGKRITCHVELAHGDKTPFVADVKPGRYEGEVFLQPVGPNPPGGKGYLAIGNLYVRNIEGPTPSATPAANITPLPGAAPAPTVAQGEAMLAEINRLQTALAEANAEIDRLKATLASMPPAADLPPGPVSPVGATDAVVPAGEAPVEAAPVVADGKSNLDQAELTDTRRISESPISQSTRRSRGRGGPLDHGANAETPDAFQEKR